MINTLLLLRETLCFSLYSWSIGVGSGLAAATQAPLQALALYCALGSYDERTQTASRQFQQFVACFPCSTAYLYLYHSFVFRQSLPPPDPAPSLPQPARKVSAAASATGPPASAQTGSSGSAQARRRHASSGTPRASSSAAAAATGEKDPDPSLVLAMAMGCSLMPGGDDLLTRDAVTIAEYIGLMSYEAVAAEDPGMGFAAARWQQVSAAGGLCWIFAARNHVLSPLGALL